jgi:hypothetical protein
VPVAFAAFDALEHADALAGLAIGDGHGSFGGFYALQSFEHLWNYIITRRL